MAFIVIGKSKENYIEQAYPILVQCASVVNM